METTNNKAQWVASRFGVHRLQLGMFDISADYSSDGYRIIVFGHLYKARFATLENAKKAAEVQAAKLLHQALGAL